NGRPFSLQAEIEQTRVFRREGLPNGSPIRLAGFQSEAPPFGAAGPLDVAWLLSGFNADVAARSFQVRILGNGPQQYHLELRPRDGAGPASLATAEVLLDKPTLRPDAVRFVGPDGETEVVYLIDAIEPADPAAE